MRVLVTSTPGLGHVLPLLPLALELRDRGHEILWATGADNADIVASQGVEVALAGMPVAERMAELQRRHPDVWSLPESDRRLLAFSTLFGELAAPPMLEALAPVTDRWRPDVVLHDAAELAGPIVAAAAGIPSVCHGFGEVVPAESVALAGERTAPLWERTGIEPDPYGGSYRGMYVDIYPPSLGTLDMSHVPVVQRRRPADGVPAEGDVVYVTFGTAFNAVDDQFRAAVEAAAHVAAEVVVTVGPTGDPGAVGAVPDNVTVARFVPQAELLPRCTAVVSHGGSGTVLASLAHGIPLLCLPRAADQFRNAGNVARVGAGVSILPAETTDAALRGALDTLLGTDGPRAAARALAEEIGAMPTDTDVAEAIEAYASSATRSAR